MLSRRAKLEDGVDVEAVSIEHLYLLRNTGKTKSIKGLAATIRNPHNHHKLLHIFSGNILAAARSPSPAMTKNSGW
jgi:hypothetical protein